MEFKDYYATLGVQRSATQDEIKRAYRKLARKFHPDVSKEPNAEVRFKEVAEAHEALIDPERRAAYDDIGQRLQPGQRGPPFEPPPGWASGFEFSGRGDTDPGSRDGSGMPRDGADFSEFFESLFGRTQGSERARHPAGPGKDHHAKVVIDLLDAYRGAQRTLSLRVPVADAEGRITLQQRQLEVNIPKGVREGQHLRLAGQGAAGHGGAAAGDLYLEIGFRPHPAFRIDGRDVTTDLPVTPSEAALGATVTAATPEGAVQLTIPPGSVAGRKLRLKGRGLPGVPAPNDPGQRGPGPGAGPGLPAGDLYAVLAIALPPAHSEAAKDAYRALASASMNFNPRTPPEAEHHG